MEKREVETTKVEKKGVENREEELREVGTMGVKKSGLRRGR